MELPNHCVSSYHGPANSLLPRERLRFRSETMARTQGANCPGDLTPVRALDFRARNSHADDKGS
jgi:hypothetical protein